MNEDAVNTEATGAEAQEAPVSEPEASGSTLMGGASEQKEAPEQAEENAEQGAKPQAEEKAPGAPEEYAEFNAPEGVEFDAQTMGNFKGVAKELNLSQEQAQKLIDQVVPSWNNGLLEKVRETSQGWADKCMADAELGGSHFQATQANVARIINTFGRTSNGEIDPDIAEFINSPMGNHPGALKLISRAGAAFGEAKFPSGGAATNAAYSPSDFYRDAKR